MGEKELYKKFFKRIFKHKKELIKVLIVMLGSSLLYVSIPFILKIGVQRLYLIQSVGWILALGAVLIIAGIILGLLKEKYVLNFAFKFVTQIKKDLFKGALKKSIHKFKRIGTGKVLAYLTYNTSLVKSLVNEWGAVAIQQLLNFIAIFIASFFVDIRLAILFFAILPIFIIYMVVIQWIVKKYALKLMTFNKQIFQSACGILDDFDSMKIMGTEESKHRSFSKLLDKDMKIRIQRILIYQYNKIVLHGMSLLLVIAFIAIGGGYLHQQEMTFSEFVFFVLYIHLLFRPFEVTLYLSSFYEAGKIGIKTVFPYLSSKPFKRVQDEKFKGNIEIQNVMYR
ncbi:ABC transporter transmembrane domain-containing protein, partial [Patescibacteria group bacterium]